MKIKPLHLIVFALLLSQVAIIAVLLPHHVSKAGCHDQRAAGNQSPPSSLLTGPPSNPITAPQNEVSNDRHTAATQKNDPYIRWGVIISGILALITFGIAIAAVIQAIAAKQSAQAIMNAERAWLIASIENPPITPDGPYMFIGVPKLTNKGKTPGFVFEIGNTAVFLKRGEVLPPEPSGYKEGDIARWDSHGLPVAPSGEIGRYIMSNLLNDSASLRSGDEVLWVHGYVKYWDVFDRKQIRETRYCFRCNTSPIIGMLPHTFVIDGPTAYSRAT